MANANYRQDHVDPWDDDEYDRNAANEPLLAWVARIILSGMTGQAIPPKRRKPRARH